MKLSLSLGRNLNSIDTKINQIQKSTRTLLPFMLPVHDWFRLHSNWYYRWHITPWARISHWSVLAIYLIVIMGGLFSFHNEKNQKISATGYDYPRWETISPFPTGSAIYDIDALDSDNVWTSGADQTILHFDGTNWVQQKGTGANALTAIDIYSQAKAYAVDSLGNICRYDGLNWTCTSELFNLGLFSEISDIRAFDPENIWVVGEKSAPESGSRVAKFDGTTWSNQNTGSSERLNGVSVIDQSTVWAVGETGRILKTINGGESWSSQTSPVNSDLIDIIALDENTAWAVGESGKIIKTTNGGTLWVEQTSGTAVDLNAIYALDSASAWAVGNSGEIIKTTNGSTWASLTSGVSENILSVLALDTQTIYAGSALGAILKSSNGGTSWTVQNSAVTALDSLSFIDAVALSSSDNIYISQSDLITGNSQIAKYDGSQWQTIKTNSTVYYSINNLAVLDETHLWATDQTGIVFYNGSSWSTQYNPSQDIKDLYAQDASNVFAVGTNGAVYAFNGTAWSIKTVAPAEIGDFFEIRSANLIYSYETDGTKIYKYNGTEWSTLYSGAGHGATSPVSGFSGVDDTHIWSAELNNKIYFFNGTGWAQTYNNASHSLRKIKALSADKIWVVGDISTSPLVLNYNGSSWSVVSTGASSTLNNLAVFDQNNILIAGSSASDYGYNVLNYHSPENATATKYLVKLPGQDFVDGVGIIGTPDSQKAGTPFTATVYAVDVNNRLDRGNASFANIGTTDPNDISPGQIQLTQNGTCTQTDRTEGDLDCGIGTVSITFHTSGTWKVTVSDPNLALSAGESNSATVSAGDPTKLRFSTPARTTVAGRPTEAITIELQDQYSNKAQAITNTQVQLSNPDETRGYFASDPSQSFEKTLIQTITSGIESTSVYYLDYKSGSTTIKAETVNMFLTEATQSVVISEGPISPINSTINITSSAPVSNTPNVTFIISLKDSNDNPVSGKQVKLTSSKAQDVINLTGLTNASGQISGTIHSRVAGISQLRVYDASDDIYLQSRPSLTFEPLSASSLKATSSLSQTVAGEPFTITLRWLDLFGNVAKINSGNLKLSFSDVKARISAIKNQREIVFGAGTAFERKFTQSEAGGKEVQATLFTAGNQTVAIEDEANNLTANLEFVVLPTFPSPYVSRFELNADKVSVGSSVGSKVTILDKYSNPIQDKTVTVKAIEEGDLITITPKEVVVDQNGVARFRISSNQTLETTLIAINITDSQQLNQALPLAFVPATALQNLLDTLRDNEVLRQINQRIIKPITETFASASLFVQIMGAIPQGFHFIAYGITALFEAKGFKRRRKPWGIVYDALTRKPLSLVTLRLFEYPSRKLVATEVSDNEGKFEFTAPVGQYHITATREEYRFPSTFFASRFIPKSSIEEYDRYLGQPFVIKDINKVIDLTIPLDPINPNWTIALRAKWFMTKTYAFVDFIFKTSALPILIIGTILSTLAFILEPSRPRTVFVLLIYFGLTILTIVRKYFRSNQSSIIYDAISGKGVKGAVVAIFDYEFNMLRTTLLTDENGIFRVLLKPGTYRINIDYPGSVFEPNPAKKIKYAPISHDLIVKIKKTQYLHFAYGIKKHTPTLLELNVNAPLPSEN